MKALLYHEFQGIPSIEEISEPICPPEGAIIRVEATGLCRSDWHGWMGHDDMIQLPHVPGHEFAGIVTAIGPQVRKYQVGQRVTAPFVCGCNRCSYCERGDAQVCPDQTQPGFTHFGSFAERVVVHQADLNLVPLPASMTFAQAAGLGCRFATSYRAVVQQGQLKPQQWLVVFGCGGVGLSAILIGRALNARVLAVDVSESSLRKAQALGAERTLNPHEHPDVIRTIRTWTSGGADVTLDASGHRTICYNGIASLKKQGRHVQVGLLAGEHVDPPIPMGRVIADELTILGSHGMAACHYPQMFHLIKQQGIDLSSLIGETISLAEAPDALMALSSGSPLGMTMILPNG